jgi:predicted RNA-binding Zn ribbon-like protein
MDEAETSYHSPTIFIADSRGLDFLNSIATPVDRTIDWIEDGDALLRWLEQARLVSADILNTFRAQALPGELDNVADQARNLREWFRTFVRDRKGRSLAPGDLGALEPLNRLLKRGEAFSEMVAGIGETAAPFQLRATRKWHSPDSLLLPIAEALAQTICTEDFAHVKACEGSACTLLFADHTRGRARRWCSMAACGNRAKQATHRSRLKGRVRPSG